MERYSTEMERQMKWLFKTLDEKDRRLYCSKHNPIEHRVFPHVTRAFEGMVLKSVDVVKSLMERTRTRTGLSVTIDILSQIYETGRKAVEHLKSKIQLVNDTVLP